jgi:GntR family transcriptional repressor for pyruvate dehydrogenase complex
MKFKRVNRTSVSEEIIEHIKSLIRDQVLKSGDQLPSEEKMAEQMGVGRGTIREALKVLIYLGLIERRKKGTYIASLAFEKLRRKDIFRKIAKHRDVMEMVELRKIIEPEAAGMAAERADPEEIDQIEEMYRLMSKEQYDVEDFISHDIKFHLLILKATGNSLITEIMQNIQRLLNKNQHLVVRERRNIIPRSVEFHGKVCNAIKNRNKSLARKYMLNHILDVEKEMYQIFKQETE